MRFSMVWLTPFFAFGAVAPSEVTCIDSIAARRSGVERWSKSWVPKRACRSRVRTHKLSIKFKHSSVILVLQCFSHLSFS